MTIGQQDHYTVSITLHGGLPHLLQSGPRQRSIHHTFSGRRSVKDLIESLGIPHTEIDRITINALPRGFDAIIEDGDAIVVDETFTVSSVYQPNLLREKPLAKIRFVLDVHLGTLARRLRLLGFDTDYLQGRDDPELADISAAEDRILLTRDRRLLMRRKVVWGMLIRSTAPLVQTTEVLNRLSLWDDIQPYSRCITCNGELYQVEAGSDEYRHVRADLPHGVTCWCTEFVRCRACRQVFWKGSHFDKMENILAELRTQTSKPS